jgi:plastocyanin
VKPLVVAALGLVALGAALPAFGSGRASSPAPARVQVVAREFSFQLSRLRVKPGRAVIELANFGQDAHDLRVQRVGAKHVSGTPIVKSGRRVELTVALRPGTYRFWCAVADHRARGMSATLVVR